MKRSRRESPADLPPTPPGERRGHVQGQIPAAGGAEGGFEVSMNLSMRTRDEVSSFWKWFQSVCGQFGDQFENENLVSELDVRVSRLGQFSWELGPGVRSERNSALVLTPEGDPKLLRETQRVIRAAPSCPGWEFYPAKPPKRWDLKFLLHADRDSPTPVDASGARYVLYKHRDGLFDVVIADEGIASLSAADRNAAAEIIIEGELGEEARIHLVGKVDVVRNFSRSLAAKGQPIGSLREAIRNISDQRCGGL